MRSPNFGPRRDGLRPNMVVVHYTVMAFDEAIERLCDPSAEVSAHYVIDRDGRQVSLVDEDMRAWHAGQGCWRGLEDINSRSIGIELVNSGAEPFAAAQMTALESLLSDLIARHDVQLRDVIGHSDLAPDRKGDPGPRFDWARLARQGLAFPSPAPRPTEDTPDPAAFYAALHRFGYPRASEANLLAAFRARFRPAARGPLDSFDCAMAEALAKAASV